MSALVPRILGIGLATPEFSIAQSESALLANATLGSDETAARRINVLYRRSGVERRGSVLLTADPASKEYFPPAGAGAQPSTGQRMRDYRRLATPLALGAARAALTEAKLEGPAITHIVTASCTGFAAPAVDVALIEALGLRRTTQRTHVGFMGCHAAINALRVAGAVAAADPGARVLVVCVELCSLHFDASNRPDAAVANALFADGAGACIVAGATAGGPALAATGSVLFPGSADAMGWSIGDAGFEMVLSARVPDLIGSGLRPWLTEWLGAAGLSIADIRGWAVHPGGPRVLDAVASALTLAPGALSESRRVLAEHGNMSSPTVLFIARPLLAARATPLVMLAFGPGLTAEAALLV